MSRAVPLLPLTFVLLALGCGGSSSPGTDESPADVPPVDVAFDGGEDAPLPDDAGDLPEMADMGPDAEPCPLVVSPFGFRDNCNGTVTDTKTGLTWEKAYAWASSRDEARTLCEASQTAAFEDWRVPSLDEVRTLILECDNTEPGGACPLRDEPTSGSCDPYASGSGCVLPAACYGCPTNQGPVEKPGDPTKKCYLDGTFDWYCHMFWTSSPIKAKATGDKRNWHVTFYDAGINTWTSMEQITSTALRCVRGP